MKQFSHFPILFNSLLLPNIIRIGSNSSKKVKSVFTNQDLISYFSNQSLNRLHFYKWFIVICIKTSITHIIFKHFLDSSTQFETNYLTQTLLKGHLFDRSQISQRSCFENKIIISLVSQSNRKLKLQPVRFWWWHTFHPIQHNHLGLVLVNHLTCHWQRHPTHTNTMHHQESIHLRRKRRKNDRILQYRVI